MRAVVVVTCAVLLAAPAAARVTRKSTPAAAGKVCLRMRTPRLARATTPSAASKPAAKKPASSSPASAPVTALESRPRHDLTGFEAPKDAEPKFYEKGWFWPVVGGVAAAIIVTIVIAESVGGSDRVPQGELGNATVTF